MLTTIRSGGEVVGTYDHEKNAMQTEVKRLASIPSDGVEAIAGGSEGGIDFTESVTVKHGEREFFFAFVDAIERMGFDVDLETDREYVRRRKAERGA